MVTKENKKRDFNLLQWNVVMLQYLLLAFLIYTQSLVFLFFSVSFGLASIVFGVIEDEN